MASALAQRVNWDEVREEVTRHLQELIRFETVNPPGNETLVAEYLRQAVEREGLSATIVENTANRGNFVTRIKGSGNGRPLLLMGHSDVVSVEADKWTHPPFGGEIHDGTIWGRGAVDMKNIVAQELVVMLLIRRLGLALDRDLIMATFADEEAGGHDGAEWMWHNHRNLIDAEFAINEGGGNAVEILGKRFYLAQTGEKGGAPMRVIARAEPGHASIPRDDTAMLRMGRALVTLSQHVFPTVMTSSVDSMLRSVGAAIGGDAATTIDRILADPAWENLQRLPLDDSLRLALRATTRNTAVPTIIHGGHRRNVIPGEIVCEVDGRVLPGQQPADFAKQVRELLGPQVAVEQIRDGSSGIEADPDSPLFDVMRATMRELDPGCEVIPSLTSGGTDAKSLPGIKVYGFVPGRFSAAEHDSMHNHDEHITIDNLAYGTRSLFEIVTRFCSAR
jgi:acetylornithine deacetylase/succinyl-diaminopimelate desuccinylase-like protein